MQSLHMCVSACVCMCLLMCVYVCLWENDNVCGKFVYHYMHAYMCVCVCVCVCVVSYFWIKIIFTSVFLFQPISQRQVSLREETRNDECSETIIVTYRGTKFAPPMVPAHTLREWPTGVILNRTLKYASYILSNASFQLQRSDRLVYWIWRRYAAHVLILN